MTELLFEVLGALMILATFALNQFAGLDRHGMPYLALNAAGAAILAVLDGVARAGGVPAVARSLGVRRVVGAGQAPSPGGRIVSADQLLQIVGALLILAAFLLSQRNVLDARSYPYLLLNLVGAAILAALASRQGRWGFVLLEGAWTLVALAGLMMRLLGKEPAAGH